MYFNYINRYAKIQSGILQKKERRSMGMTMTQKILAAHAGLPEVKAGQLIEAQLDLVLGYHHPGGHPRDGKAEKAGGL